MVRFVVAAALGVTALTGDGGGDQWLRLSGAARASTLVQLSVEELCDRATLVVAATPQESVVVWEDRGTGRSRRIVTYTRARVDRVIDGAAPAVLWIRTLGGSIRDIGQHVDGEAVLAPGQPGVFFLRAFADGPHAVVGMAQGQYLLGRGATGGAAPRLSRVAMLPRLVAPRAGGGSTMRIEGKTLDEASALIRAARRAHAP